jgi:hypothetical protein
MSKTYNIGLSLTLDKPIEEVGTRALRKYIRLALKRWGKDHDATAKSILAIEMSEFIDTDLREKRAHGGRARAANMTPKERSKAASAAARARWEKASK